MNNKAFTLVELLAIIVILSLLITIVTPKVLDTINRNRNNSYHEIERRLEEAAAKYIVNEYIDSTVNTISITKEDLINAKYIGEIYDLKDNSICDAYVEVTSLQNVPEFNAILDCSTYKTVEDR